MDPSEVKLTFSQKIKPMLIAINNVLPWQACIVATSSISSGIYFSSLAPTMTESFPVLDFLIRRIVLGAVFSFASFLLFSFIFFMVGTAVCEVIKEIRKNFREESLIAKKRILENVIDDEILKK